MANGNMRTTHQAALFTAALLLLSAAVFLPLSGPSSPAYKTHSTEPATHTVQPEGRVLVILIDSLKQEDMYGPDMPFLSASRQRGAWGISRVAYVPLSISGTHAIFSGVLAGPFSILSDFSPSASAHDNLFRRVSARGGSAAVFGGLLHGLYARDTGRALYDHGGLAFSQYREEAENVFGQAYGYLAGGGWNLAALSSYALDHAGHLYTPRSAEYRKMLREMDDHVRRLVELTGPSDTVLITSEHGIDDNGFHVSLSTEVMDTGFILLGPRIKKAGPLTVMQPDWAPTLSLLAGVPYFYGYPGLPALDLLSLPAAAHEGILMNFSGIYGEENLSLSKLRELRGERLAQKNTAGLLIAAAAAAAGFILLLFLAPGSVAGHARTIATASILLLAAAALMVSGAADLISNRFPFSANFIMWNPWLVISFLCGVAALSALASRLSRGGLLLSASAFVLPAAAFAAHDPYHSLAWLSVVAPLTAWAWSRRPQWAVVFICIGMGLMIRRLTFYEAAGGLHLPERWVFGALAVALCASFLWFRLKAARPAAGLMTGVLCNVPALVVMALPFSVEAKALLLLLCLLPTLAAIRFAPGGRDIWISLWVLLFLLGTSSRLNYLTHAALVPIFVSVWAVARGLSSVGAGLSAGLALWLVYLLPGNDFGLDLYAFHDRLIMGSAAASRMWQTGLVVAARYVLPAGVILWGILRERGGSGIPEVSAMVLPIAAGAGMIIGGLAFSTHSGFPWRESGTLIVLACYAFVASGGLIFALLLRKLESVFSPVKHLA